MGDYVGDSYLYAKFYHDTITPICLPNMRKCASSDSASFFWFFRQPTAKSPAPIFTINTSNDAVSRKNVPFGGPGKKIYISTPFSPKTENFGQFSTGQKISRQRGLNNGDARLLTTLNRNRSPMKDV